MVQMFFSQIQQAPGPDFRKVGKSLKCVVGKIANSLNAGDFVMLLLIIGDFFFTSS